MTRDPRFDDRPQISDMLLAIIGALASGLITGAVIAFCVVWLSTTS